VPAIQQERPPKQHRNEGNHKYEDSPAGRRHAELDLIAGHQARPAGAPIVSLSAISVFLQRHINAKRADETLKLFDAGCRLPQERALRQQRKAARRLAQRFNERHVFRVDNRSGQSGSLTQENAPQASRGKLWGASCSLPDWG